MQNEQHPSSQITLCSISTSAICEPNRAREGGTTRTVHLLRSPSASSAAPPASTNNGNASSWSSLHMHLHRGEAAELQHNTRERVLRTPRPLQPVAASPSSQIPCDGAGAIESRSHDRSCNPADRLFAHCLLMTSTPSNAWHDTLQVRAVAAHFAMQITYVCLIGHIPEHWLHD